MKPFQTLMLVILGLFFLSGCQTIGVGIQGPVAPQPHAKKYKKHGPPPHAPAHGYRHKHHDGHQLEYNAGIGAYVVLNIPETYFGNNLYIRMATDGKWMVSSTLQGVWRVAVGSEVPRKLKQAKNAKKKKHKHKKKKKSKYGDDG